MASSSDTHVHALGQGRNQGIVQRTCTRVSHHFSLFCSTSSRIKSVKEQKSHECWVRAHERLQSLEKQDRQRYCHEFQLYHDFTSILLVIVTSSL